MTPRFSIVSICRNDAKGLARTLMSTFKNQNGFDDWEQIVVDGASTDGSFDALTPYTDDPHLGWHVSEPDKGIYNAMNKGAAHARGEYLLFLNSGDELLPNALGKIFPPGQCRDADIVYGDEVVLSGTGGERIWSLPPDEVYPAFFLLSGFPHQSCFIKRAWFQKLGGYDESLRIVGDTEFLLRSWLKTDLKVIHVPVAVSRYRLDGISSSPNHAKLRLEERRRVMAPYFGYRASEMAARLLSEDRPWISAQTVFAAKSNPNLARYLRKASSAIAMLWRFRPIRFLLETVPKLAQIARRTFRIGRKKRLQA